MRLDDLDKIPLNYIFSFTLAAIYKISLKEHILYSVTCSKYFRTEEVCKYILDELGNVLPSTYMTSDQNPISVFYLNRHHLFFFLESATGPYE